ncbi:beta-ketoacyl synthase N-terminal-like domain-containing protein, partial [Thermoactinomyces sp. CICC 10521]|uniref:beta-ketoacyl synthase N-terminal-like domain-containing protein n=1 Tax=Thermoactinomyces sp. CICC 10521 TaxID=2767426 RepID=UPI0018DD3CE5
MERRLGTIAQIKERLVQEFLQVAGEQAEPVDLDKSFMEMGMNSIMAVDFVEAVNRSLGIDLGVEVVFDYRGIPELAEHIADRYMTEEVGSGPEMATIDEETSSDIAIIGISGKFAGSENLEEFWAHLRAGDCCIEEIRRPGWTEKDYYHPDPARKNRSVSKWGGLLKQIDRFDAAFFDISPAEAERMDPQHRLFLEEAYKAFEDAHYPVEKLSGKKVGVFVGGRPSDYRAGLWDRGVDAQTFWGNEMSMLASRISYFFNFKGPSLTVDTACSSSLVAIHLACESIRKGESEMALAGGVFVASTPEFFVLSSQAGLLSPDGQCKTFDPEANGMVLGEGVGAAVLKRLDAAVRDGDPIYGVIKGSAVNQAGRTNGVTSPSAASQKELIIDAYTKSGIDPETIGYIEVHGTGTKLGDLIELKALTEAFRMFTDKSWFCVIGSHKPNIGHTALAAGMAGLFKILLSMKHGEIPPTLYAGKREKRSGEETPFWISTKRQEWKRSGDVPLRAGLSALGSNGTNAHLIIEEPPARDVNGETEGPSPGRPYYLFPFSAKSKEALEQKMADMVSWLERKGDDYATEDVAKSLFFGRSHFSVRCAVIAADLAELKQKLDEIKQIGTAQDYVWQRKKPSFQPEPKQIARGERLIRELAENPDLPPEQYQEHLTALSRLYVQGYDLDWSGLFSDKKSRPVPLPAYPFHRKRFWHSGIPHVPEAKHGLQMSEMDGLLCKLLFMQLESLGLFEGNRLDLSRLKARVANLYGKWLEQSLVFLTRHHYLKADGDDGYVVNPDRVTRDGWNEWERQKERWLSSPDTKAQAVLVERTLRNLPQILTGKVPATDILFPDSSMDLVEGIYRNNAVADYFNEIVAQKVEDAIRDRVNQNPAARIRIIEIGAGTGGTSISVLQKLKPYREHIQEYCYTDISKAFLLYAEKAFGRQYPYLTYATYDAEAPAAGQGIETGVYDVAIATNVLHATRDIARTLRRVKAVLKKDGLLVLNEISSHSLFLHLTFGLLQGWWLYEDETLRLPGGPAVPPAIWKHVLEREGFENMHFPAQKAHPWGQQIIIAESDGKVRQEARRQAKPVSLPEKGDASGEADVTAHGWTVNDQKLEAAVQSLIVDHLAGALSVDPEEIDFDSAFRDYGVDSITGIKLVQAINQEYFLELATTILFDYSSVNLLTRYLLANFKDVIADALGRSEPERVCREYDPGDDSGAVRELPKLEERRAGETGVISGKVPIAIIGVSGRFAKSKNVRDLWKHLSEGTNLIERASRWRQENKGEPEVWEYGGFIEDIDQFDPLFFNISGMEAASMDPQQRLFLEECWNALEDAGYAGAKIQGCRCGVYVGCSGGDYQQLLNDDSPPQAFWGNLSSVIPARIAYYLNLQGPAIAVDTACSSSLVAVHLACQGLWTGETEMALAGGVSIQCTPDLYRTEHRAGMLSPTGQCYTFDERANGFVPGEGVGVVVLKRLEDALADGDYIYGVIRGSAINQDGTTNGITAPSQRSQERLERFVYDQFGINPEEIQMVEAHGTGTKLGDPIEFQALTQAFRSYTDKKEYCAIGSIKTNIGHAQMAAGIAGLIKILLALKHKQIPPSLHFRKGNANISFKDSPFFVNTQLRDWKVEPGVKRRAAISSFGVSGTNAHMVIEEAPEVRRQHPDKPGYLLVLSARSEEELRKQAGQLIDHCKEEDKTDCGNMCYTLLVGRQHFKHRLACVVRDLDDAVEQLEQWLNRKSGSTVFSMETDGKHRELPALKKFGNHCIRACQDLDGDADYLENLATVAELYVQGYELDYEGLFADGQYSR